MKLLVAEDPQIAGFIERGLADAGHEADVVSDGDAALRLGREGRYDAIVLALLLPKKDGVRVAAELRAAGQRAPILLLTPDSDSAEVLVERAGADGYLAKPFRFDVLHERLAALAGGSAG